MNHKAKLFSPILFRYSLLCFLFFFITVSYSMGGTLIRDPMPLRERLEEIRHRRKLPAVAVAIVIGDRVVVASAVGQRKWGENVSVTRNDAFELGSITKPITGTLIGILKEQGKLDWDTTIGEMFPEMFPGHQTIYQNITVRQLLSHTSGLPYTPTRKQAEIDAKGDTVIERRLAYISAALADKPAAPPGSTYIYSGGGIIVASMAEKLTGKTWETLVTELLFQKLNMDTAGFGPMATPPDMLDAPWFHQVREGKITPLPPKAGQNILCRNPVGRSVHCSVIDLGRFAAFHLSGLRKASYSSSLLKPKTFRELHRVVETDETRDKSNTTGGSVSSTRVTAGGWLVQPTSWAKGPVYWHNGQSKGRGYAIVHIVPKQNYATCVMMNVGGNDATEAAIEINLLLVEALRNSNYNPHRLLKRGQKVDNLNSSFDSK